MKSTIEAGGEGRPSRGPQDHHRRRPDGRHRAQVHQRPTPTATTPWLLWPLPRRRWGWSRWPRKLGPNDPRGEARRRIEKWRNPGVPLASPQAEADYKARVDRLHRRHQSARSPTGCPWCVNTGWWPAFQCGYDSLRSHEDAAKAAQAWVDFNVEFKLDAMVSPVLYTTPASVFEAIDYKLYSWPGHGVAKDASYQYNEKEWMLAEEYDHLISDPSDYMLRRLSAPHRGRVLRLQSAPLAVRLHGVAVRLGSRRCAGAARRWRRVSRDLPRRRVRRRRGRRPRSRVSASSMSLGFPGYWGGATKAPFDYPGRFAARHA